MEIEILEESKNKIHFKINGEDHTILNLLKEELWNDKNVKIAAYRMDHPLIGIPEMTVEVTQGNEAKKAIADAVKRLDKKLDKLKEEFKSTLK
ncbi:DNA-directed RNA polymerase subunit L [Candidatus Woesearchaeota archaeon]|nr:DNA-directed RNA polymerase subunit L [Candidatus Woesearchaeota archaeon]